MIRLNVVYVERYTEFEHQLNIFNDDSIEIYFCGRLVDAYKAGGVRVE